MEQTERKKLLDRAIEAINDISPEEMKKILERAKDWIGATPEERTKNREFFMSTVGELRKSKTNDQNI